MKTRASLVFFGNERLATAVTTAAPNLRALIASGYDIAAVVSNYQPSRSRNARKLEVQAIAEAHNIPLLLPDSPLAIIEQLRGFKAQAGILVAYGRLVPQAVIDVFPSGIINIHPSLLPSHRGSTPIESVMLEGSAKTGVSIMRLAKAMDSGPLFSQSELPLDGNESKQSLADTLLNLGKDLLLRDLPGILDGSIPGTAQNDSQATYDSLLTKADGLIDWHKPAERLEREIRAFLGWPGSRTALAGKHIIITQARLGDDGSSRPPGTVFLTEHRELAVQTGQNQLIIERLKLAGKTEITAQAFLAGHTITNR